jgi:hypothetical protein
MPILRTPEASPALLLLLRGVKFWHKENFTLMLPEDIMTFADFGVMK